MDEEEKRETKFTMDWSPFIGIASIATWKTIADWHGPVTIHLLWEFLGNAVLLLLGYGIGYLIAEEAAKCKSKLNRIAFIIIGLAVNAYIAYYLLNRMLRG